MQHVSARLSRIGAPGGEDSQSRYPRLRQRVSKMSKPNRESKRRSGSSGESPVAGQAQQDPRTRIDPAHDVAGSPRPANVEPAEQPVAVVAAHEVPEKTAGESVERCIQAQADQLGMHLRSRQKELDHRESQINARLAAIDRDMRAARLWLKERDAEIAERTEMLDRREAQLATREDSLRRNAANTAHSGTAPTARNQQKTAKAAERRVEEAREEADNLRKELQEARRQFHEEARQQRQRMAAEQRTAFAEIERQRESVRRRAEHVDQSRAALEQLRAELSGMHRETLEIRLATEELWAQLSSAAPPASLTKSLSGIRGKLADQYRIANAEIQEQKAELEAIRSQLAEQYEKVVLQKQRYDQWSQQHRKDAEADASRLAAREAELRQFEAKLHDRALQWQAQRLDYEQQIRRLQARCSGLEAVPV